MKKIKTLILDQAKTCGFAIYENKKLKDYGLKKFGNGESVYEDILYPMVEWVKELYLENKIDKVVIENIQHQVNINTYYKLALIHGALICLFKANDIDYEIISPSTWKSFCKIKARKRVEQKKQTIEFVQNEFRLKDIKEDIADAIALGYFIMNRESEEI